MDLSFGLSSYARSRGNIAEMPVVNMIAEAAPSEGRVVLQSRSGLSLSSTVGNGPVRGLYRRDGVLSGDLFAVSGSTVFKAGVSLGVLDGAGQVSFAAGELEMIVNAGSGIYRTTGAGIVPEVLPENMEAVKVLDLAGYFVAIRAGTARFYWRLIGDPVWDELDYATAENEPDRLLDGLAIDDYLVIFGTETVEFWPKTGDAELPFLPTTGRVFEKGIRATGCAAPLDNSVAWVSGENIVYRAGNVPDRISDSGIEERIEKSASCSVFSFFWEGHEFLAVRLDRVTLLYDAQTRQWCEWESYGRINFAGRCVAPGPLFGDDASGKLWSFNDGFVDDGGPLERRFRAGSALDNPVVANAIRLIGNSGQTRNLTGSYSDPIVEIRSSRDAGQTWSDWRRASLGRQGNYRERVEWRALGMFDDPGALFEFRVTDPVPFRVSRVQVNPSFGGRARG